MSSQLLVGLIVAALSGFTSLLVMLYLNISGRLRLMEIGLATVNTQVSPLWAQVQSKVAQELHHDDPRYAEMDGLLERLIALKITTAERARLKQLLVQRVVDPTVGAEEQKSAKLMIAVMEKVLVEATTISDKLANVAIAFILGSGPISVLRCLLK
jgi:hypothetical protein